MISKIKTNVYCPFCRRELGRKNINDRICSNEKCISWKGNFYGSEDLWQALIQVKQDLEITRKALKEYANKDNWGCIEDDRDRFIHTYWYFDGCNDGGWVTAEKALEQIDHKE